MATFKVERIIKFTEACYIEANSKEEAEVKARKGCKFVSQNNETIIAEIITGGEIDNEVKTSYR